VFLSLYRADQMIERHGSNDLERGDICADSDRQR
jgi:hypothetical protein